MPKLHLRATPKTCSSNLRYKLKSTYILEFYIYNLVCLPPPRPLPPDEIQVSYQYECASVLTRQSTALI
jgi:hypothetical protein